MALAVAGVTPVSVTGRWMSTKTYGHLHEDDRAWFIADSFKWLVEHDRGEPMRAQKAHECYACGRAIPAGEQYRRLRGGVARINVKVHERCYQKRRQETQSGRCVRCSLGSSVSTTRVLAHHALAALAATGTGRHPWCGGSGAAGVPSQPDAPELMRSHRCCYLVGIR